MKKQQMTRSVNQPTKSTSLSNFNFINKDDTLNPNSAANLVLLEQRQAKEKQW